MPDVIYLRKSRADMDAEARGEGETLARHEAALLELAKRLHKNVTQIYREVVSGETIAARPMMQKLLSEVSQGLWDSVLVMEVERLARGDTIDQGVVAQTFKFSNTQIITPIKTYDPLNESDEEYFEFGLFMSRREYKAINRRLQRGRIASVKEGKYVGNKPPYGYRRVKIEKDKGYTLEPVPEEAKIVRLIFTLYVEGEEMPDGTMRRLGAALIARRLNALHVPTATGLLWTYQTVIHMLRNPVYCGKIRWNYRATVKKMVDGKVVTTYPRSKPENWMIVDGLHPAIVSLDLFEKAQALINKNPPHPLPAKAVISNPLAGLLICGKCGRHIVRRPRTGKDQKDMLACPQPECKNAGAYLDLVEAAVLQGLKEWLTGYKLEWKDEGSQASIALINAQKRTAKRLEVDIETLNKQLENVYSLLEQGIYTTDKFLERSQFLAGKISATKEELEQLTATIHEAEVREESRKQFIPKVEYLLDVYNTLPTAQAKNDLLKGILEKVIYVKEERARRGQPLDNFTLTLFPKIPPPSYWEDHQSQP